MSVSWSLTSNKMKALKKRGLANVEKVDYVSAESCNLGTTLVKTAKPKSLDQCSLATWTECRSIQETSMIFHRLVHWLISSDGWTPETQRRKKNTSIKTKSIEKAESSQLKYHHLWLIQGRAKVCPLFLKYYANWSRVNAIIHAISTNIKSQLRDQYWSD